MATTTMTRSKRYRGSYLGEKNKPNLLSISFPKTVGIAMAFQHYMMKARYARANPCAINNQKQ